VATVTGGAGGEFPGVAREAGPFLKPYWTYAASTCTGNRGLKSRLSLPAMSLRRHW
jgi:hypothetical protein